MLFLYLRAFAKELLIRALRRVNKDNVIANLSQDVADVRARLIVLVT